MVKISIIIPVYNVQKYLEKCLDTLRLQTYVTWEAILIDDGSTDLSGQICDCYMNEDSRFHVIHKKNEGAARAKNTGLDYCSGEYIAFIDSDDYVESDWLEKVVSIINEKGADIVEFNFDKIFCTYSEVVNDYGEYIKEFTAFEYLEQYPHNWSNSLFCNKIFRANLLKNIRFHKERRCIDDEFFTYKAIEKAKKIVRVNEILYHYRQRASSVIYTKSNGQRITGDALDVLIERYEWICVNFPDLRYTYMEHDINIMFFFAKCNHNKQTAKKFREISHYYLKEVLICKVYGRTLKNAIKLQFISTRELLKEKRVEHDLNLYFE